MIVYNPKIPKFQHRTSTSGMRSSDPDPNVPCPYFPDFLHIPWRDLVLSQLFTQMHLDKACQHQRRCFRCPPGGYGCRADCTGMWSSWCITTRTAVLACSHLEMGNLGPQLSAARTRTLRWMSATNGQKAKKHTGGSGM